MITVGVKLRTPLGLLPQLQLLEVATADTSMLQAVKLSGKSSGFRVRLPGSILSLPFTNCVTLDKWHQLSGPWFLMHQIRRAVSPLSLQELREMTYVVC